jgi:hypothetical protein
MALLFLDSFDHYATADLPTKYGAVSSGTITAGAGRRAGGAVVIGNGGISWTLSPGNTTVVVGMAVKTGSLAQSPVLLQVSRGGPAQLTVSYNTGGFLQLWRGNFVALLGTAVLAPFVVGTTSFLELKADLHPTAGSAILRVNEAEVLNLAGINTAQTGTAGWDGLGLFGTLLVVLTIDDLYVLDGSGAVPLNTFLGDCRVDARYPTGAGATTGWTPSAGANWAAVDDAAPNGDTDYVSAGSVGLTDTYTIQDAPVPGAVLYGVQLCASLKKSDAGTCSVAPVVRHAGTDNVGTASNPGTAYGYAIVPYGTNPGTGAAWTEAGFNAAEFGVKRTA